MRQIRWQAMSGMWVVPFTCSCAGLVNPCGTVAVLTAHRERLSKPWTGCWQMEREPMAEQLNLLATGTALHPALTSRESLLSLLQRWQSQGWIRALDLALGRFLHDLDPEAEPLVILAAVLASHQLGRGHICTDLDTLLSAPDSALSLPPDGDRKSTRLNSSHV